MVPRLVDELVRQFMKTDTPITDNSTFSYDTYNGIEPWEGERYIKVVPAKLAAEFEKALRNLLLIVEHGIPEPSHEGSCGPWAACDGNCEARAYCSEYVAEAKRILSNVEAIHGEKGATK